MLVCGIAGLVSYKNAGFNRLNLALARLSHRGPDSAGLWQSECQRVVFGHRRLSIIDLSTSAQQPMSTRDGRYTIVFNGELYNFAEVRNELQALGYQFTSSGDTEVLLYAYAAWGEAALQKLNGMFAFAIHDRGTADCPPSVFFARDRVGEKPLYLTENADGLWFASELKALPHGGQIDLPALNHYLALGYVPGDMCLFEGVRKLPPAHCGRLMLDTRAWHSHCYWRLPENKPQGLSPAALAARAGELIEDSVRLRLVADVPVGVLLSGGLDSSLVVGAAARVSSAPVETFTIALPGSPLDEAHHAQKVASYFGTRHHVLPLQESGISLLDGLAPYIDEPIADSSILPAWLVFGLARQQVTVALGGDGGDELFGGYTDYKTSLADQQRYGWIPAWGMRTVAGLAASLPAGVRGRNRLASMRGGPLQQIIWGGAYYDIALRQRVLNHDALRQLGAALLAPEHLLLGMYQRGRDPLDGMTRRDFHSILPDDFLVKVDRASMAHSLEVRAPLLDHRLVEFAFGEMPSEWKVAKGESRRLQRLLAKQWLPPDLDTQRKQGFSIPVNEWLRSAGERDLMARMEGLPTLINMDQVRDLVRGHMAGRANGGRLFALIMLAIAMRNI